MKLGKTPARLHARRLWLSKYLNRSTVKLDAAPARDFGQAPIQDEPTVWNNALGNADYGCCFWAASFRAVMAKIASTGNVPAMTPAEATKVVLNAYAAACGFDPNDPNSDVGTDALAGMNFLQQTGFTLPDGSVHRIGSYAWINPQDYEGLLLAHNLFDGLYIGVRFPGSWMRAPVWDLTNDAIEGGHEVFGYCDLAVTPEGIAINSWGERRVITAAAMATFADEIAVSIGPEMFGADGKSIAGFDAEQLQADERAMAA